MPANFIAPPPGYTSPIDGLGEDVPGACCSMFSVVAACSAPDGWLFYLNYQYSGGCSDVLSTGKTVAQFYSDSVNGNATAADQAAFSAIGGNHMWPLSLEPINQQCQEGEVAAYVACRSTQIAACVALHNADNILNHAQSLQQCLITPCCYITANEIGCQAPMCGVVPINGGVPCDINCFYGWGLFDLCQIPQNTLFFYSGFDQIPPPIIPPPITPPPVPTEFQTCCDEVNASLTAIANAIAQGGSGSALLAPLQAMAASLNQLNSLVQQLINAIPPGPPVDLSAVIQALKDLNTTLTDPIGKAATTIQEQGDVPQPIIDALSQMGILPGQVGQLVHGAGWATVEAALASIWHKLNHPPTTEELNAAKNDPIMGPVVNRVLAAVPNPPFKELLRNSPAAYASISLDTMDAAAKAAYGTTDHVFEPFIADILALRQKHLSKLGNVKPCDEYADAVAYIADAMQLGVAAHWAALSGELFIGRKHVGTNQFAAFITEFAGFKDVAKVLLDPELNALIRIPHTYCSNAQARSILPDLHNLNELHARGLIDDATWAANIPYTGIQDTFAAPLESAAHRAAQPFALLRGLGVLNVDTAPAIAAMQFAGFRTQDIDTLLAGAKRQGLQPLVNATINQFVLLAGEGLMTDAALTTELQSLDLTTDAINLILARVHVEQTRSLAKAFKSELDIAALAGEIDLTDYSNSLLATGYDQAHVDVFAATVNVRLEKATLAAEARQAAAEARAARSLATRTALDQYRRGQIGAAQLSAELIAAGVSPAVAGGYVALASVQTTPSVRIGSTLSQFAQGQVEQRFLAKGAIENYKKALIPESTLRSLLASAGYSPLEIDYEVSYLNALTAPKPAPPA